MIRITIWDCGAGRPTAEYALLFRPTICYLDLLHPGAELRAATAEPWTDQMTEPLLSRITATPEIFGGKPIIRGMRISVELVLSLLAQGESIEAILDDYPELEPADIRACLAYAHAVVANDHIEAIKVPGE